jgi:hypothetical protein
MPEHDRGTVLTHVQRERFARDGWIALPGPVDSESLDRLRTISAEFVDSSRTLTESNVLFDLDEGHTADEPRLRRLSSPTDLHDGYWEFAAHCATTTSSERR